MLSNDNFLRSLELVGKALILSFEAGEMTDADGEISSVIIDKGLNSAARGDPDRYKGVLDMFVRRKDDPKPRTTWAFMKDMRRSTSVETVNIREWADEMTRFYGDVSYEIMGADKDGFLLLDHVSARPDAVFTICGKTKKVEFKNTPSDRTPTFKIADLRRYHDEQAAVVVIVGHGNKRIRWTYFGPVFMGGLYEDASGCSPGEWRPRSNEKFGGKQTVTIGEDEMQILTANNIVVTKNFGSNFPWNSFNDRRVSRVEMDDMLKRWKENK